MSDRFYREPEVHTFESSMSALALSIGNIERNPPRSEDDLMRLRLLVSRLDTTTTRAARALENENAL